MIATKVFNAVRERLVAEDTDSGLINFVDDEVDWYKISDLAITETLKNIAHRFTPLSVDSELCICTEGWNTPNHV